MAKRAPIDVFRYLDYRAFLAEYYRVRKRRGFSYRAFSRRAGLSAPNYLKLVIDGRRNLTPQMASRFARACDLHGDAADYFEQLVRFNQARQDDERNDAYRRLSSFRRYRRAQKLELAHAAYHGSWYLPAIRELIGHPDFRDDPAWIARQLWPQIREREARDALATLEALEMVRRDDDGRLQLTHAMVSTGPQTESMHIGNYHRAMLERAGESIERVPAAQRDLSSVTLSIDPAQVPDFKQRLQRFRRELLELASPHGANAQVVQLNLQLFPLTHPLDADGDTAAASSPGAPDPGVQE